jgi:hypothetical protein
MLTRKLVLSGIRLINSKISIINHSKIGEEAFI